jgi:flagellar FliL protein
VATKPNDEKNAATEGGAKPKKSKASLLIIIFAVLALVSAIGFGVLFYLGKKNASEAESESVVHAVKKTAPVFLALDNMVINLADPGGEKVAQVGVTLELLDSKASDKVKVYLPSIRSKILLQISQRESGELLSIAGKEKLAADILIEALRPFTPEPAAEHEPVATNKTTKPKKKVVEKPQPVEEALVSGVHFSSFIIQ